MDSYGSAAPKRTDTIVSVLFLSIAKAMMIYKAFRFDDMQFLTELMIYNASH